MTIFRGLTRFMLPSMVCSLGLIGCAGSPLREDPGAVAIYMATGGLVGEQHIRQLEQEQRARYQAKASDRFERKLSDEQRIDAVVRLAATKFFLQTGSGGRFNVSDEAGINALAEKLRQSFSSRRYLLGTELRTVTLPSDTQLRTFALCFGPYSASEPKILEQLGQQCLLAAGLTDAVYREVMHSLLDVSLISVIRSDATIRTYVLADVAYAKNNREEARSREGISMTSEPRQEQSLQALPKIIETGKRKLSSGRNHDFACAAAAQQLGAHYLNRGNLIKASSAYTDAISCDALDPHAWEARATVEKRRGNDDFALRYRDKATELRSLSMPVSQIQASFEHPAPAFHQRGQLAHKSGQYAEAIELFTKEIDWYRQHAPTSRQLADAIIARADAYALSGQSQRTKDDLDAAIAATSDPIAKLPYLGARERYYRRSGQLDLADADLQAVAAIGRDYVIPQAEAKQNERMEEVRRAQEAVSEKPMTGTLTRQSCTNGGFTTVKLSEEVAVTFTSCSRPLQIQGVKLPIAIQQELMKRANDRGIKLGFDLSIPFMQWRVSTRENDVIYQEVTTRLGGHSSGGQGFTEWGTTTSSIGGSFLVQSNGGPIDQEGANLVAAHLGTIMTLWRESRFEDIYSRLDGYLDTVSQRAAPQAKQQNGQPVDVRPRASCGKSTFTVAEGVSVSWTCDKQGGIAITEAKLPVAVGQELLAQAAQHGTKISFDLTLPFFAWWVKRPVQSSVTVHDQKKLGPDGVAVSDHLRYLLNLVRESRFAELRQIIGQYVATLTAAQAGERSGTSATP